MGLMETSSARAWAEFRTRLADHLAATDEVGSTLCLDVPVADEADLEGSAPSIQVRLGPEDLLGAEVSGNGRLDESCSLSPSDEGTLRALGWSEPDDSTLDFHLEVDQREADRLAVLVVRTLREVFDVLHPSFLTCDVAHLLRQGDEPADAAPAPAHPSVDVAAYDESHGGDEADVDRPPTVQFPTTRAEVVRLVDATLAWFLGHDPYKDDDLDIPIVCGQSVVYVRVLRESTVLVQSEIVRDIADPEAARFEVNVLNRDHADVQFSYADDTIRARRRLSAFPFAARQVHDAVEQMCALVEDVADDLVERVHGRLFLDDAEERDDPVTTIQPSPEILTMVQLEAARPGSLDADLVAAIFEMDRDLLLAEIAVAVEPWQLALLRGALRVVVEADAARLRSNGRRIPQQRSSTADEVAPHRPVRDPESR